MDGPVVAEFQKMFIDTWDKQHGPTLAAKNYYPKVDNKGPDIVRGIGSAPEDPYSVIYATFISAIQHAESKVYLSKKLLPETVHTHRSARTVVEIKD